MRSQIWIGPVWTVMLFVLCTFFIAFFVNWVERYGDHNRTDYLGLLFYIVSFYFWGVTASYLGVI